eukprot:2360126-Rhodomonas_salina.3
MAVLSALNDKAASMERMSNADSQRAVRCHRIAESKEMVAERSESFLARMAELESTASNPSFGQLHDISMHTIYDDRC